MPSRAGIREAERRAQVLRAARACIVALNKWDAVPDRNATRKAVTERLEDSLAQMKGIPVVTLSALTGVGMDRRERGVELREEPDVAADAIDHEAGGQGADAFSLAHRDRHDAGRHQQPAVRLVQPVELPLDQPADRMPGDTRRGAARRSAR